MNQLADIQAFLSAKRIAVVGASRDPRKFSRVLMNEFVKQGYETVPVNPNPPEGDDSFFANVCDVAPTPEAALVMTGKDDIPEAVRECREAGIKNVWIYGTNGHAKLDPTTAAEYREKGMILVQGECPFMFLGHSSGLHRFHGFVRKIFGSYPK